MNIFKAFLDFSTRAIIVLYLVLGDPGLQLAMAAQRKPVKPAPSLAELVKELEREQSSYAAIAPLPTVTGQKAGYVPGSFSVSERGTATYEIPITLPEGIGGMKPDLALSYDSRGSNGLLGVGWSLKGLSSVGRCSATIAQDGFIDGIDFDANDKLCLDGQRLVHMNGTAYGVDGEYRTENDNFSRITFSPSSLSNGGLSVFEARTKSGLLYSYGFSPDSRIEASGRSDALLWYVSQITDSQTTGDANRINFHYYEDNASGQHYISRIDYTANRAEGIEAPYSVHFIYESRPDLIQAFVAGSRVSTTVRLKEIQVTHQGALIDTYILSYQQSLSSERSRLNSIQRCSETGSCLAATTFNYTSIQSKLKNAELNQQGGAERWSSAVWNPRPNEIADITGDGIADAISFQSDGIYVWESNGSGFNGPGRWSTLNWNPSSRPHGVADLTGDGIVDVFSFQTDGIYVWRSTGSGFYGPVHWSGDNWAPSFRPHGIADLTGDGKADVFSFQTDGIYVWESTGSGFNGPSQWSTLNWSPSFRPHGIADLTGDGLTDIFSFQTDGLYVWESTGSGFNGPTQWSTANWDPNSRPHEYVDITGDGITDLLSFQTDGLYVWESTGTGFYGPVKWSPLNWHPDSRPHGIADVSGDGKPDVFSLQTDGIYVWESRGNGFWGPLRWSADNWHPPHRPSKVGDLTGDGKADFISLQTDGFYVWPTTQGVSDLLSEVVEGHGKVTVVEHSPLTDSSVYTKGAGAAYPAIDVQNTLPVVSAVEVSDGVGGMTRLEYEYEDLKYTLNGRGFCGFSKIKATNVDTGEWSESEYFQPFPFKSLLKSKSTFSSSGVKLSSMSSTWDVTDLNGGANYFVYERVKTEEEFDVDGSLLRSNTVTTTYDNFGNDTTVTQSDNAGNTTTTVNTYENVTTLPRWHLGRLTRSEVTKQTASSPARTKVASFEYDSDTGRLTKEVTEPDNPTLRIEKSYQYDGFGNIRFSTIDGPSITPRVNETKYDSSGKFVSETVNALGHTEVNTYDQATNQKLSVTGPNGLTTSFQYDEFDRLELTTGSLGTQERTLALFVDVGAPSNAVYYTRTDASGSPTVITYFDVLDREIRIETVGFTGETVIVDKVYNAVGELVKESEPYFEGDTPRWVEYEYDDKERITKVTQPGNRVTTTTYAGLVITTTNPLGQKIVKTYNLKDQLVKVKDHQGNEVTYGYDSHGNLVTLTDQEGNVTTLQYDIRDNRISIDDPGTGVTTSTYNELGELIAETDAKGQTITQQYDVLGRMVRRTEAEGATDWYYDTRPNGIGSVASIVAPNYAEDIYYDNFSRIIGTDVTSDQKLFTSSTTYDEYGRVSSLTYPSGYQVDYGYDTSGFLIEVSQASDGAVLWTLQDKDAKGRTIKKLYGNGLKTFHVYHSTNDYLVRIRTGSSGQYQAQDLRFQYDAIGNLKKRFDLNRNLTERFTYDSLNRLKKASVDGGGEVIESSYDSLGNITYRSDVGNYTYGGTGPHAVTSIQGIAANNYDYDANGNRVGSNNELLTYTSFDKPSTITKGSTSLSFEYGPSRNRYKQIKDVNGSVTTKYYIGGNYERIEKNGTVIHKNFIRAEGGVFAIQTETSSGSESIEYLLKDHLGSIQSIANAAGQVIETLSFNAWGQRRNADTWVTDTQISSAVDRGFTGHEQLDDVGLIHMNGRVYDPAIGRFLSADPNIQAPENTQNLNRYSYVLNNPLSFTDPSGFFFKKLFKAIFKPISKVLKNPVIRAIATAAFLVYGGVYAPYWLAGFQAAEALANGGSLFDVAKSAAISFAASYAFGGIDAFASAKLGVPGLVLSRGVSGGVQSVIGGGKFKHGFFSAAVMQAATAGFSYIKSSIQVSSDGNDNSKPDGSVTQSHEEQIKENPSVGDDSRGGANSATARDPHLSSIGVAEWASGVRGATQRWKASNGKPYSWRYKGGGRGRLSGYREAKYVTTNAAKISKGLSGLNLVFSGEQFVSSGGTDWIAGGSAASSALAFNATTAPVGLATGSFFTGVDISANTPFLAGPFFLIAKYSVGEDLAYELILDTFGPNQIRSARPK